MKEYPKIQTMFKRNERNRIVIGDWTNAEFQYLQHNVWEFTEKVDGTNIRIGWDGHDREIGGRTDKAKIPEHLLVKLIELFPEEKLARVFPFREGHESLDVTLYGEGYGQRIQKKGNLYNPNSAAFVLFDIRIGHWWLKLKDIADIGVSLGVEVVPVIGSGTLLQGIDMVRKGFNSKWGNFTAEGIVAKPAVDLLARNGERIICKLKHQDFKSSENIEE